MQTGGLRIDRSIIAHFEAGFKGLMGINTRNFEKFTNYFPNNEKNAGSFLPAPYPASAVTHPNMTCTERQVGCRSLPLLLPASAVRQSGGGRSANRQRSLTSQFKNVGPNGHTTYQAGNLKIYSSSSVSSPSKTASMIRSYTACSSVSSSMG